MKTFLKLLITCVIFLCIVAVYYFYPDQPLPANARINKLVVWKSQRKMMAYQGESLLKTYTISLGKNPVGDKQVY